MFCIPIFFFFSVSDPHQGTMVSSMIYTTTADGDVNSISGPELGTAFIQRLEVRAFHPITFQSQSLHSVISLTIHPFVFLSFFFIHPILHGTILSLQGSIYCFQCWCVCLASPCHASIYPFILPSTCCFPCALCGCIV